MSALDAMIVGGLIAGIREERAAKEPPLKTFNYRLIVPKGFNQDRERSVRAINKTDARQVIKENYQMDVPSPPNGCPWSKVRIQWLDGGR